MSPKRALHPLRQSIVTLILLCILLFLPHSLYYVKKFLAIISDSFCLDSGHLDAVRVAMRLLVYGTPMHH